MHKKELVGDKIKTGHENTSFLFETPGKEKVLFFECK